MDSEKEGRTEHVIQENIIREEEMLKAGEKDDAEDTFSMQNGK